MYDASLMESHLFGGSQPRVDGITLTIQQQPNQIKRAKRAHNSSAACCNRLLGGDAVTTPPGGASAA